MSTKFTVSLHAIGFVPVLWKINGETHAFPLWWSISYDGNRMGKKALILWKIMNTNFPGCPGFCCIFKCYEKLMGKPMHLPYSEVYYRMWESDGEKAPILWKKYECQFPRLFPYKRFCCIFPYYGKFMGTTCVSRMRFAIFFFKDLC